MGRGKISFKIQGGNLKLGSTYPGGNLIQREVT